jgi:hypothetical protein
MTEGLGTNLSHTLQLCARAEDRLACHALEQNRARAGTSRSVLGFFDAPQSSAGSSAGARERALDEPHGRRARCASCEEQGVQGVLPRFVNAPAQALASGVKEAAPQYFAWTASAGALRVDLADKDAVYEALDDAGDHPPEEAPLKPSRR